ncbi:MAG: PAS domain S-box protein, partial [Omnitrophica WOR_2 bacterium]
MTVQSPKSRKPRTSSPPAGQDLRLVLRMFELTPAALFYLTGLDILTARIQYANPAACSLAGSKPEDLKERVFAELVNPRDLEQLNDANPAISPDSNPDRPTCFTWELHPESALNPQRQPCWQVTCQTGNYEGEAGWLLTAIDISERKQAERGMKKFQEDLKNRLAEQMQEQEEVNYNLAFELAERERMEEALEDANERLHIVLDSIAEAYFVLDYDFRFIEMNHVAEQNVFHRPAKDLTGRQIWVEFPQGATTDFYTYYQKAIETGKEQHFEAISKITGKWYEAHVYPRQGRLEIYLHDINERKEAEAESQRLLEQLEAERRLWKTTVEGMPIAVTLADAQGRAVYMNPAYTEMIARTIQKDLPMKEHAGYYQIYHPDGSLYTAEDLPLQKAALTGEVQRDVEILQRSGMGEEVYAVWNAAPLRDQAGKITGAVAVGRDITAQRKAEAALRESAEQYRRLVQLSRAAIVQMDETGKIVFFNSFAQELFGYKDDEVLGKNSLETITPPQDSQGRDQAGMLDQILSQPESYEFNENENIRKDGRRLWVTWTNQPLYREDSSRAGIVAVGLDITQRKQAEMERERLLASLELERTRLRTVLETLPVGVAIADEDGRIVELNDRARDILGNSAPISPDSGIYDKVEAWKPDTGEKLRVEDWGIARALLKGEIVNEQVVDIRRLDGEKATLLHAAAPLRDRLENINGAVGVVQDITRMKRVEDELRQARDELEVRVELRTHELQLSNEKLSQTVEELRQTVEELISAQEELEEKNLFLLEARKTLDMERQRYQELFDLAPDGYLVTDPSGNIQEANQAAAMLFQHQAGFLVGKPLAIHIGAGERQAFRSQLNKVKKTLPDHPNTSFQEWEFSLLRPNQEPVEAALTVAP